MVDLDTAPYDLRTFSGRLSHFVRLTSPLNLARSYNDALQVVQAHRENPGAATGNDQLAKLWQSKYVLDSTIHPDTKEKIFLPFRMAAFVPTNLIITVGLLMPNPTIKTIVFWQWLNQSVNVGINWANANKTTEMSMSETGLAYVSAVTASVTVAVGLNRAVQTSKSLNPAMRATLARFVPFTAVAAAGVLNVFLMRRKELVDGIDVRDEDGTIVGKSKTAGWYAVSQVALSRVAISLPCLTIPPLILSRFENLSFFKGSHWKLMGANFGLITLTLLTALPVAIALFPQTGEISVAKLEDSFQSAKRADGTPVKTLSYNKGL